MITEVKDIDPFRCGWKRDVDECLAMACVRATTYRTVDTMVKGVERRHFGYLYLMLYRGELA